MSDLVKRLRAGAGISRDRNINLDYAKVADEAADRIEELERENADLRMQLDASCNAEELRQVRAENAALKLTCANALENASKHLAAREALEAENAALRAENSKLRAALAIVHFKQEPLQ
jgi:hypothetical protein